MKFIEPIYNKNKSRKKKKRLSDKALLERELGSLASDFNILTEYKKLAFNNISLLRRDVVEMKEPHIQESIFGLIEELIYFLQKQLNERGKKVNIIETDFL